MQQIRNYRSDTLGEQKLPFVAQAVRLVHV
jgi:hypothetical protein